MGRIRDFSKMNSETSSFARSTRKHVTLNIDADTIEYFKSISEESGIPFQAIISIYLSECKNRNLRFDLGRF